MIMGALDPRQEEVLTTITRRWERLQSVILPLSVEVQVTTSPLKKTKISLSPVRLIISFPRQTSGAILRHLDLPFAGMTSSSRPHDGRQRQTVIDLQITILGNIGLLFPSECLTP